MSEEMDHETMNDGEDENMDNSSDDAESEKIENADEDRNDSKTESKVYLPGQPLGAEEELVVDKSTYRMLHHAQSGAPCLSFDIILDDLGSDRETYPLSMYIVGGTQAAKAHVNNLLVMKMTNLHGINARDSEDESSDSEDEDNERVPIMTVAPIKHQGCVNRVR